MHMSMIAPAVWRASACCRSPRWAARATAAQQQGVSGGETTAETRPAPPAPTEPLHLPHCSKPMPRRRATRPRSTPRRSGRRRFLSRSAQSCVRIGNAGSTPPTTPTDNGHAGGGG